MARLYTLTDIAKKAGVSMPTMLRYKKLHQDRIPSEGEGRKQRYPAAAVAVVRKIKEENLKSRGRRKKKAAKRKKAAAPAKAAAAKRAPRPRKKAAKKSTRPRKKGGRPATKSSKLLSLAEIGRRTQISYPTLIKYQKMYGDRIPSVGEGRRRRYPEEAVEVFRELRAASGRGRRRAPARARRAAGRRATVSDAQLARRVRSLERAQREIARELKSVIALLKKPMRVTIHSR